MGLAYTQRSDGKYEFKGTDGKTYISNDPTGGWEEEKTTPATPSSPSSGSSSGSSGSNSPYPTAYYGQIPVTMKNGIGYIGDQKITDLYPNIQWTPSDTQLSGGAWGSYSNPGQTDKSIYEQAVNQVTGKNFEDTWNKFMEWAQPYMKKPDISTPDYDEILDRYTSKTRPLYDYQMDIANRNKKNDIAALAENLASRGVYNSDMNETEAAKIYANYATDQALRDANYQATLAELTDSAYQNQLNQALAYEQQWNQNMLNLGLQLLNGQIDEARFISDDAYRNALLSQGIANDVLSQFGIIK